MHPSPSSSGKTFLILSQVFVPDPASVGQHIADVAFEMARRGHRVLVYTANRGYDDPTREYPAHEMLHGVEIRRLRLSSFGKKSIATRLVGTASFMLQSSFLSLTTPNVGALLFSTSPPMIGLAASVARMFRGIPIIYWAMDLNPDQLIAMRKIAPRSPAAMALETANRFILRGSRLIITLDRFMAGRLLSRGQLKSRMLVLPPWPHEDCIEPLSHAENRFRHRHGLDDKFVVMYSGNHSPANPLDTLLNAAVSLRDDPVLRFLFVGGGVDKKRIEAFVREHELSNCLCLPYQPMSELRYSLSAADVHVVSLGENMVGIVHPCKVYGAMAAARPILYFGPRPSHVTDLLDQHDFGLQVAHGDVEGAVSAIRRLRALAPQRRADMGAIGQSMLTQRLSQAAGCGQMCDAIEKCLPRN